MEMNLLRMKKIRICFIFILVTSILTINISPVLGLSAGVVRIGLFYNDSSAKILKAVESIGIGSDSGITVGSFTNGQFITLYDDITPNTDTFRKDTYFTINNSKWVEYLPSQGNQTPGGIPYGPWHVQLGGPFPDYATASLQAMSFKQAGIPAFPVYMDTWYVWTGFYVDQVSAQTDIQVNLHNLFPTAQFQVIEPSSSRVVVTSPAFDTLMIFSSNSGTLRIRARTPASGGPAVVRLNTVKYRGDIELRRISGSDMTVVNILSVEEYLYGVIPCEIESWSPPEALKAQAVAARTYAYSNLGKHNACGFDLCDTSADQVYKGFSSENAATNKAVDDTAGKCVMYNGSPASVFYFSSSGGETEDSSNVWGASFPYLKSVEDKYESGKSYNYNWVVAYSASKIKDILVTHGIDIGDIEGIEISKYSEAGRAVELTVQGVKSQQVYTRWGCKTFLSDLSSQMYTITTDADVFAAGAALPAQVNVASAGGSAKSAAVSDAASAAPSVDILPAAPSKLLLSEKKVITASGVFTFNPDSANTGTSTVNILGADNIIRKLPAVPTLYTFTGKGWGHAVGMSQEGAKGMAAAGFRYDQILMYYFPGTQVQ